MSTAPSQSFAAHIGYVLRQNPVTMIAFGMLAALIFCAVFGPMLAPYARCVQPRDRSHTP